MVSSKLLSLKIAALLVWTNGSCAFVPVVPYESQSHTPSTSKKRHECHPTPPNTILFGERDTNEPQRTDSLSKNTNFVTRRTAITTASAAILLSSLSQANAEDESTPVLAEINPALAEEIIPAAAEISNNPVITDGFNPAAIIKPPPPPPSDEPTENDGYKVFKSKSGLKYIDLREGTGPSPNYGDLVSISYKGYVKVATNDETKKNEKPPMFEADDRYLIKHGNGKVVRGLDEGLHTMKTGGKRRIIIPPKLGYVQSGIGPIPSGWIGRYKLNKLLDDLIKARGGQVIFEVELLSCIADEADQGYYEDDTISFEDFETLRQNLINTAMEAKKARTMEENKANNIPIV